MLPPYSQHNDTGLQERLEFVEENLKKLLVSSQRSNLVVEVSKCIDILSKRKKTRAKVTTIPTRKESYSSYSEPDLPKGFIFFHILHC